MFLIQLFASTNNQSKVYETTSDYMNILRISKFYFIYKKNRLD